MSGNLRQAGRDIPHPALGGLGSIMDVRERLEALRRQMVKEEIDAYIVLDGDFHGSEYVGDYFRARTFMSGFTGSAGTLLVLRQRALLWTDGRYYLQAEDQLAGSAIELMRIGCSGMPEIAEFLAEELSEGSCIGFDGRTVSSSFIERIKEEAEAHGGKTFLFSGDLDLVDAVWKKRPPMSKAPVWELDAARVGLSREKKLVLLRGEMQEQRTDCILLTSLDEIAWLLNLRGNDVAYTPVFLAYMLISMDLAVLCVNKGVLPPGIQEVLKEAGISFAPYEEIEKLIADLPEGNRLWIDSKSVNYRLVHCIPGAVDTIDRRSPVELMKAVKTPKEIAAIKRAHEKDGAAVTRFIRWLKIHVGKEAVTEISAAEKLLEFRAEMDGFLDQSFSPIVAYKEHGAIVHYEAAEETDAGLLSESYCLVDTGGHYADGTTDVTRTIALGPLTEMEKEAYTLVLRGHLNLAGAKFPEGVCGQNLDYLARAPLWEKGLDFNHGTGHGVGFILSVHEGPQRFHWRIRGGEDPIPFKEGMVISNEPGLYLEGKFGIRHENLMLCRKGEKTEYGQFLFFEPLTMVPFDRDAVNVNLMTDEELSALNAYHKKVYETLSVYLKDEELEWLKWATERLKK